MEDAWPEFVEKFCEPDGRLRFARSMDGSRDGADDFYEAFYNWPAFYSLGGSDEILQACKFHWQGVTKQLTELGLLSDEYEKGYDWFHQGESLIFFYALCAADPSDVEFADRARRFADLYAGETSKAYDRGTNTIGTPHNGALGLRPGLGPEWETYPASLLNMRPYGLPLEYLQGITTWDDLADPAKAERMGTAMQTVLGTGDVPANLCSTSLVVNRWLYDGDESSRQWVERYVHGWMQRAHANGGLIPDNVAPDGEVGGLHGGRWFGGHYGWTWPHGLSCVGMAALVGAINAAYVTNDMDVLDLARAPLDWCIEQGRPGTVAGTPMSLQPGWLTRLGADAERETLLVPHRYGREGWFDYGPVPMSMPTWLWWFSRDDGDWQRLRMLIDRSAESPTEVKQFRDKEEAGHEIPWISFLTGENPTYPEAALRMALQQVEDRLELMRRPAPDPRTIHIHYWQQVQPVVTEILTQLTCGAPQMLYNGGLPLVAVCYVDDERDRPGLPEDVSALVRDIRWDALRVELVNLSGVHTRRVWIKSGRFGERMISRFRNEAEDGSPIGPPIELHAPELLVTLPPGHGARLNLTTMPSGKRPQHRSAAVPNDPNEWRTS